MSIEIQVERLSSQVPAFFKLKPKERGSTGTIQYGTGTIQYGTGTIQYGSGTLCTGIYVLLCVYSG